MNQNATPFRFLALGDSYTIGEAVEINERWPNQFVGMMAENGVLFENPQIIATTGWTTDELSAAIDRENPQGPFDLVSLLIGVNNQYRGYSLESYQSEFETLLKRAIDYAGGDSSQIIVISIPDWGATPFAADRDRKQISIEIDAFNEACKTISLKYEVAFIDITPHSRLALNASAMTASDHLHPSGIVYTHWARLVKDWFVSKK
jgi:lysophospholipase L1-like esterase